MIFLLWYPNPRANTYAKLLSRLVNTSFEVLMKFTQKCPSSSCSQSWTRRCRLCLLPALRLWLLWSESSEFSWAWPCSAWTSSSTYTHTQSLSSTSTSFQVLLLYRNTHTPSDTQWCSDALVSLSGYEGVPQFFSSLLSHIESVLDKQISAGPQAACSAESTGGPSAAATPLWVVSGTDRGLLCFITFLEQTKSPAFLLFCWDQTQLFASAMICYLFVICNMTLSESVSSANQNNNTRADADTREKENSDTSASYIY